MAAEEKLVNFPEALDGFGNELNQVIEKLSKSKDNNASIADIIKTLHSVSYMQQLMVMMYNLSVTNYENLVDRFIKLEKQVNNDEEFVERVLNNKPNDGGKDGNDTSKD